MSTPPRPQIFITHSSRNIGFARRLYNDLKAAGFPIWFDAKSLQAGHRLAEEINRGLEWCDVYVPILSASSLASPWCQEEINAAITLSNDPGRQGRPRIIPVLIEQCESQMPALLRARLFIQFAGRYDEALQELKVRGLGMPTHLASAQSAYASAALPRQQVTPLPQAATPPPRAMARSGSGGLPRWAISVGLISIICVLLLICGGAVYYVLKLLPTPVPPITITSTWTPTIYIGVTPWTPTTWATTPAPAVPTTVTPWLTYTWTPSPTPTSTYTRSATPTRILTTPPPSPQTLFFDDFGTNMIWETTLPNGLDPVWQESLPTYAIYRYDDKAQTALYSGGSKGTFTTFQGISVLRLKNNLDQSTRKGWSTSKIFPTDAGAIRLEARFNTVLQSRTTGIDQLIELWILDTSYRLYDKAVVLSYEFGNKRGFSADSTIVDAGRFQNYTFADSTWYRLVITGSTGQRVRASLYNDANTSELVGVDLGHTLSDYPSGFRIGFSQSMGRPGGIYPTDVAIDWIKLTFTPN